MAEEHETTTEAPGISPVFRASQPQSSREAAPSVRVASPAETSETTDLQPTFLEHEAVTGSPFVADHYGLSPVYRELSRSDRLAVESVERYVDRKIRSREFSDSAESARAIISDLESRAGLSEHNDPYFKLGRLAEFLSVTQNPDAAPKGDSRVSFEDVKKAVLEADGAEKRAKASAMENRRLKEESERLSESKRRTAARASELESRLEETRKRSETRASEANRLQEELRKSLEERERQVEFLNRELADKALHAERASKKLESFKGEAEEREALFKAQQFKHKQAMQRLLKTL